jgi:hypothetical protein
MRNLTDRRNLPRSPLDAPRWTSVAWVTVLALLLVSCAGSRSPASVTAKPDASAVATRAMTPSPRASSLSSAGAAGSATAAAPPGASSPTPGPTFTLLRMATMANPALPAPDATTFVSHFSPKAPALFVVFALRPGLTGTVACTIEANGVRTAGPIRLAYGPTNSWGDFKITSRGTFVTGTYRATVVFVPTGEVASITFSVP